MVKSILLIVTGAYKINDQNTHKKIKTGFTLFDMKNRNLICWLIKFKRKFKSFSIDL